MTPAELRTARVRGEAPCQGSVKALLVVSLLRLWIRASETRTLPTNSRTVDLLSLSALFSRSIEALPRLS